MSDSTGSFGSDSNRGTLASDKPKKGRNERAPRERGAFGDFLAGITPEQWIDIACCAFIAVFLIAVAFNWAAFSEALFRYVLFPVIDLGAKIVTLVATVAAAIGAFYAWLRSRRRRRWWRW